MVRSEANQLRENRRGSGAIDDEDEEQSQWKQGRTHKREKKKIGCEAMGNPQERTGEANGFFDCHGDQSESHTGDREQQLYGREREKNKVFGNR